MMERRCARPGVPTTAHHRGDDVQRGRKILLWAVLAFVVYAIVTSPAQAAGMARDGGSILADGARGVGQFFDALLRS
jgi:hypothetical protein